MAAAKGTRDVRLVTERLILRDFVESDWPDAHAYRSDPEVARYMLTHEPESPEQTRAWLDEVIAETREQWQTRRTLAIVLQAEHRVIGEISVGPSPDDFPAEGEIGFGYMLNREVWGQGYTTEAARAVVDFGFEVLGARQVSAWCFAGNRASARVLEKAGLRLELREEDVDPKTGQPRMSLKYTIHRREWQPTSAPEGEG
jgi:[ribosomal protein S5]-alanine N-acetyltransferase